MKYPEAAREAGAEAGDIVIVGGGPVGVEMAGEIRDKHGDKNITVVSSSDKLVSKDFDDKFQTSLKAVMDRRKVSVCLKDRCKELI